MRISTNTASCMTNRGTAELLGVADALKKLHSVGYDTVDLSFVHQDHEDFILRGDDWEKKIEEAGMTAEELGITISQCHFPFVGMHDAKFYQNGYAEYYGECLRRAYIAAGMLGIPHGVIHPITHPELNYESKASLEANHAYYDKYIELGIKHNVGTAIENMLPFLKREHTMRYCQHYDQLIELVDSYQNPMVGICWDTGHANQMGFDQRRALRAVGKRLKGLHMNDNHYGNRDEHVLPFMGENDWYGILETLIDIGYEGDLTYETGVVGKLAPGGAFQDSFLKATHENGMCMLQLYNEILKKRTVS